MQKKIVCIHDLSGLGKCSLSVALPIISALKAQCCPFPTTILSNQSEYPKYTFLDLTSEMKDYKNTWKELSFQFDSIYTGFLGSYEQISIVQEFIKENPNSLVVVDPVMGDDGKMYDCFDEKIRIGLKELVRLSHLTTPNITEAAYITGFDYTRKNFSNEDIKNIAKKVSSIGPSKVVLTGIKNDDKILNLAYNADDDSFFYTESYYNNKSYSGTGDIFASILCAMITRGYDFEFSVKTATTFIGKTIEYTSTLDTDRNDGVFFEEFLNDLTSLPNPTSLQIK
ncbi:MAG: pyridoxamine kinase [Clostridioides sp.]|jgi:pyridoxine kinase|nr:pyridoxamine kinase [Clostridioides sp.]